MRHFIGNGSDTVGRICDNPKPSVASATHEIQQIGAPDSTAWFNRYSGDAGPGRGITGFPVHCPSAGRAAFKGWHPVCYVLITMNEKTTMKTRFDRSPDNAAGWRAGHAGTIDDAVLDSAHYAGEEAL